MTREYSKILTGPSGETCRMFISNKDMLYNGTDVVYKGTDIPLDNSNYEIYGISGETYTIKQGKSGIIGFDTYGNTIPSNTPFMGYINTNTNAMELYYKNNTGAYDVIPFNKYNINNTNFINEFTNDSSTQKVAICGHTYIEYQPADDETPYALLGNKSPKELAGTKYLLKSDTEISFQEYLNTATKITPTGTDENGTALVGVWGFGVDRESTGNTTPSEHDDYLAAINYGTIFLATGKADLLKNVRIPYKQDGHNGALELKQIWYIQYNELADSFDGTNADKFFHDITTTNEAEFNGIYVLWTDITV